ncbi:MAG: hypothetical protein FWC76_02785 [Defluviitaleaceae bacterium]|nr:hypothetical protein [Defluviitaleaceae bacterium]
MCINIDVDVSWIASAMYHTGFSTAVGLAMTVGRLRCCWKSAIVEMY